MQQKAHSAIRHEMDRATQERDRLAAVLVVSTYSGNVSEPPSSLPYTKTGVSSDGAATGVSQPTYACHRVRWAKRYRVRGRPSRAYSREGTATQRSRDDRRAAVRTAWRTPAPCPTGAPALSVHAQYRTHSFPPGVRSSTYLVEARAQEAAQQPPAAICVELHKIQTKMLFIRGRCIAHKRIKNRLLLLQLVHDRINEIARPR